MLGRSAGARKGLRWSVFVLAAAIAIVAIGADTADARRKKKYRGVGYNPPYAAIVVDANSGDVMHASNADATRHPASLTKIMTLYLLFEQIEAGKFQLDDELRVSAHAASQAPSKLALRPGQTIDVEDAIKALVTKSANDVAVVVAEALAGDEDDFARQMTRKARSLGMNRTIYKNASGLPNPGQITTARDQARLGRAIQDRFPKLYRYFATARFHHRGRTYGNHNKLLGRVQGIDGIKTGYVRASGFNLVSSMRRGNRHVVAVVMGGKSGRARDARMRSLLEGYIVEASVRRTTPKLTEIASAPAPSPRERTQVAAAEPAPMRAEPPAPAKPLSIQGTMAPAAGSADPIRPIIVRTLTVRRAGAAFAAVAPEAAPAARAAAPAPEATATISTAPQRHVARGEWVIQVGAFPAEAQAQDRLKEAQSLAKNVLASAAPFTERVVKGDTTLFRARFAGFNRDAAQAACNYLKRNEVACLALKN